MEKKRKGRREKKGRQRVGGWLERMRGSVEGIWIRERGTREEGRRARKKKMREKKREKRKKEKEIEEESE